MTACLIAPGLFAVRQAGPGVVDVTGAMTGEERKWRCARRSAASARLL